MTTPIKFYGHMREYGFFSNFAPFPVSIRGLLWPTTEHFYQAMKFENEEYREKIRATKTPGEAKRLGNVRKYTIVENWDDIKYEVMLEALRAKFMQYETIRQELLNTGNAELQEAAPRDYIWGIGKDGTGQNLLGKALMQVRAELS